MNVALENVTKAFGSMVALDAVSFSACSGAIHALVGENGAGKTTLMRVLYGALQSDSGTVRLDGQEVSLRNSREAIGHGVGMVSQHYSVIPELSCLQNLMLGAETSWLMDLGAAKVRAEHLAQQMGYSFSWDSLAETLSPAGKQKLEILKLLWRESKVMILDEPTAMLSPADSDALFASLKKLAAQGSTVLVVTHRLPEVMDHCSTVTVLRGGKTVAAMPVSETDSDQLAELIVGHAVGSFPDIPATSGAPRLVVKGITVGGYRGDDAVAGLDLTLSAGEVVGLAGVDGNGQRELFQALVGTVKLRSGAIVFDGNDWTKSRPRQRIAEGLRLIPEDRHAEGVIDEWSLEENSALGVQRLRPFAQGLLVDANGRRQKALGIADRFRTKHAGLQKPMKSLSGGNQQRFVAARALETDPELILAFQPTRGLDIDGTAQVYGAIQQACRAGACALVVSFDLDELLAYCDRVVAISHGNLFEPAPHEAKDRLAIGRLMVGAA